MIKPNLSRLAAAETAMELSTDDLASVAGGGEYTDACLGGAAVGAGIGVIGGGIGTGVAGAAIGCGVGMAVLALENFIN